MLLFLRATFLLHSSISAIIRGLPRAVKQQRKVEECSSSPKEPTLPLLHALCGALSAAAPLPPTPAPSLQVSGLQHKEHRIGGRQGGHIDSLVFSEVYITSRLPGSSLPQPAALLLYPPPQLGAPSPLWATWLPSVFPSSTQSAERIKLLVQAVVRKELSEAVTFTDVSLFPWLLGQNWIRGG